MASWYELNATVTLSVTASSGATVALRVVAPDGTATTPTATFSGSQWSATVTGNQYDEWSYAWTVDGVLTSQGTFTVGGPWYVTLATLKKTINRTSGDTTPDDLLAPALTAASRSVEQYCDNRPIGAFLLAASATARIFRRDRWVQTITLGGCWYERLPVDEFGSLDDLVVETSDDGTTWTAQTIDTDFETWPDNALTKSQPINALITSGCWPARIRVTGHWGWPDVPSAVKQATLLQASRLYRRKDSPEGVAGGGDWGLIRVPNLDPDVKALLAWLHTDALVA